MKGALHENMFVSEEVGCISEARADDIVICCWSKVNGVFLGEPMAGDDLGAC